MKKIFLTLALSLPVLLKAQVGIGTATPTAKLDVNGDLRIRSISDLTSQPNIRVLVADPAIGIVGYANVTPGLTTVSTSNPITGDGTVGDPVRLVNGQSADQMLLWDNTAGQWNITDFIGWKLRGNTGTNPSNDYVGTNDNADLAFRTDAIERVRITIDGFVGVSTPTPITKFHMNEGSLLVESPLVTPGSTPLASNLPTGAGTRFLWNHNKAAHRMGGVSGGQWDDANIGQYSFAAGYDAIASGWFTFAVGNTVAATDTGSTALGKFVNTVHAGSFQLGDSPNNSTAPFSVLSSSRQDEFSARFAGGYRFFTAYNFQSHDSSGVFYKPSLVGGVRVGIGNSVPQATLHVGNGGSILVEGLAGTGNRMVVANAQGVLSSAPIPSFTAGQGINISSGTISVQTFTGDLLGNAPSPQVSKIQNRAIFMPMTPITDGSVLRWNQSLNRWEPFSGFTGTVSVRRGDDSGPCTMTYQNGLLISTTCP